MFVGLSLVLHSPAQEVQETVLAILIDFRNEVPLETLQPYTDPTCRALLYKVFFGNNSSLTGKQGIMWR